MASDNDQDSARVDSCDVARLLAENERWLRTVLLARSGDPLAVADLFQEVALAVLRNPPQQIPEARRPAWLYGVAVRTAVLHRRKAGRQRRLQRSLVERPPSADPSNPLLWLLSAEREQLVRQALEALGPKDREILLLKYTEDWSYVEIADHLGLTVSAVEARLHRARHRLRGVLAHQDVVEVNV